MFIGLACDAPSDLAQGVAEECEACLDTLAEKIGALKNEGDELRRSLKVALKSEDEWKTLSNLFERRVGEYHEKIETLKKENAGWERYHSQTQEQLAAKDREIADLKRRLSEYVDHALELTKYLNEAEAKLVNAEKRRTADLERLGDKIDEIAIYRKAIESLAKGIVNDHVVEFDYIEASKNAGDFILVTATAAFPNSRRIAAIHQAICELERNGRKIGEDTRNAVRGDWRCDYRTA